MNEWMSGWMNEWVYLKVKGVFVLYSYCFVRKEGKWEGD